MSSKKIAKPKAGKRESPLNLRNLPTKVSGFPDAFFTQYCVEIHISGRNSTVLRVRELTEDGTPGRFIQADEARKLASAGGLVRDIQKKLGQTDANDTAKRFFYNSGIEPTKVKDPTLFVKQIGTFAKNLKANKRLIDEVSDHVPENIVMKKFMHRLLAIAKDTLGIFLEKNKAGQKFSIKEAAKSSGLPMNMLGKTLTDTIKMSPGAPFWSTLIGKDPSKFCNFTIEELIALKVEERNALLGGTASASFDELVTEDAMLKAFGITDGDATKLTQNQKEKYLSQSIPINFGLSKTALLQRAESAKTTPRKRSMGIFPKIDILVNLVLSDFYISPPVSISELQTYWEKEAGKSLDKPEVASKTFSAQVLAILSVERPQVAIPPDGAGWPSWREFKIDGVSIEDLEKDLTPGGRVDPKYLEYNPVCFQRKPKAKADRFQQPNSMLAPMSSKVASELERKFGREIGKQVKAYLGTFTEKKLQTMAAEIVWLTCHLDKDVAEQRYFHVEPEEQKDDLPIGEDEGDPRGSEEDGSASMITLPEPDPGE